MATRCIIGKVQPNGRIRAAYCHFDGYYNRTGKLLVYCYTDDDTIDRLINLGGFSSLEETVDETAERQLADQQPLCLDRADICIEKGLMDAEYTYVREKGAWYMYDHFNENCVKLQDLS